MRISTDFKPDYSFDINGFDERLNQIVNRRDKDYISKLNKILTHSMREAADIRKHYLKAMSDDNRISSHERNDIIHQLNEFIVSVIYLREALGQSQSSQKQDEIVTQSKIVVTVGKSGKFNMYGRLSQKDLEENKDFSHWHNESFIVSLKSLLEKYQEAVSDEILTLDEIKMLYREIAVILYDAILIRYLIEHCVIDN